MTNAAAQIQKLEEFLLQTDSQFTAEQLDSYFDNDFEEINNSGDICSKQDAINWLVSNKNDMEWHLSHFKTRRITDEVMLATYQAKKTDPLSGLEKISIRSSLWKQHPKGWKMLFHQGTNLTD